MPKVSMFTYFRHGSAWLVLLILSAVAGYWWWAVGRPVVLPDAPSARIACVSYAPFRQPGETPLDPNAFISPQRIDQDLRVLSQRFGCLRTYSQGQGLSEVPSIASHYGMKVLLGIWLGSDLKANERQIRLAVDVARAHPDALRGVVVGNEVMLRRDLSPAQLIGYLREVRAAIHVPVTYADVWESWLSHPELAASVDFITVHILPFWEDEPVSPERAVAHVAVVYAKVQHEFPGRSIMIGETGWPSAGRPRQAAVASLVNEARYIREFLRYAATVDMPYNLIETFDQPWKRVQEGTAGGYWGIFDVHAKPKFPMTGPVTEESHWWLGWLAGALVAIGFALFGAAWRRGWRGWASLLLAGFASGCALAWQFRQMWFACNGFWEWAISLFICAVALLTAFLLMRVVSAQLAGISRPMPTGRLRFFWLFALTYYGLLLVFDGRYRDFPIGLFALPCAGFALASWLSQRTEVTRPGLEQQFLAAWLPVLGTLVLVQEAGLSPVAWVWLLLNLALAATVLVGWLQTQRQPGLLP